MRQETPIQCKHIRDRPWKYLSQGERQRILIGRALMADLKLLILDEPCAGLDPAARNRFLDFLESLTKSPNCPTLIYVTHHVEEIISPLTHVLILKAGKVLASGKRENVLTSQILSEAFDAPFQLIYKDKKYNLLFDYLSKTNQKQSFWTPTIN